MTVRSTWLCLWLFGVDVLAWCRWLVRDRRFNLRIVSAGGSKDRERSHQPQGCGAGWFGGPVQNQETHTPKQTNEGVLWTTGELKAQMTASTFPPPPATYNYYGFAVMPHSTPSLAPGSTLLFLSFASPLHVVFISVVRLPQGLSIRQIRFRFDGQPINETDTPAQVRDYALPAVLFS